jgi:hypothetical protein
MSDEYEYFMKLDTTQYIGEYVAICDKKIVSHSKSFKEAYNEAKKVCRHARPFVAMVPPNQTMLL